MIIMKDAKSKRFAEAEKMAHNEEDFTKVENEIREVCQELGLAVVNKEGFFEFIDELNKTDNSIFEFKDFKENYFKNKFENR